MGDWLKVIYWRAIAPVVSLPLGRGSEVADLGGKALWMNVLVRLQVYLCLGNPLVVPIWLGYNQCCPGGCTQQPLSPTSVIAKWAYIDSFYIAIPTVPQQDKVPGTMQCCGHCSTHLRVLDEECPIPATSIMLGRKSERGGAITANS